MALDSSTDTETADAVSPSEDHSDADQEAHPDALYPTLERDVAGWDYVGQFGGALANWVDDAADPRWAVTIMSAYTSAPPEGYDEIPTRESTYGTRVVASRQVNGYKLVVGPSKGNTTDSETVATWWGTPDQTPREVEADLFTDVLRAARVWMHDHRPSAKRAEAICGGFVPDPMPEAEADAGNGQNTLDAFAGRQAQGKLADGASQ